MRALLAILFGLLLVGSAQAQFEIQAGRVLSIKQIFVLGRDCKPMTGAIHFDDVIKPQHGNLYPGTGHDFPDFASSDPRSHCDRAKRPDLDIVYKPNAGFRGVDRFRMVVHTPDGRAILVTGTVQVQ
jgi:hypothetical protein